MVLATLTDSVCFLVLKNWHISQESLLDIRLLHSPKHFDESSTIKTEPKRKLKFKISLIKDQIADIE